jgi:hypothetical protein
MCVICNCDEVGAVFLSEFASAQKSMTRATTAMLACSQVAHTEEQRKSYGSTHKKMVRILRAWNKLEHIREMGHKP